MAVDTPARAVAAGFVAKAVEEQRREAERELFTRFEWEMVAGSGDELTRWLDAERARLFPAETCNG